jgi:Lon protease-like protein
MPLILPASLPIFPLPNVVLFANVFLPLHIFEPRYRAMVADALAGDRIIGMVLLQPGYEGDYDGRPPVYPTGCAGVITHSEALPDGRYNIVLRGIDKFRILTEDASRPYRLAEVEALPGQSATPTPVLRLRGSAQGRESRAGGGHRTQRRRPEVPARDPDEDLSTRWRSTDCSRSTPGAARVRRVPALPR